MDGKQASLAPAAVTGGDPPANLYGSLSSICRAAVPSRGARRRSRRPAPPNASQSRRMRWSRRREPRRCGTDAPLFVALV
jgi:hypothetical protein